jgi:acetyl esterase/lipase
MLLAVSPSDARLGAQSNVRPPIERRVPPPAKVQVSAAQRDAARTEIARLETAVRALPAASQPDVEVFVKAARFALDHDEFYTPEDPAHLDWALRQADERLAALREGKTPWVRTRGTSVRGLRSAIDGSVQPYCLTVPPGLDPSKPAPLYLWLHGRGDTSTDLHFIHDRSTRGPQGPMKQPEGAMILEPFGRQSLGWKSTGEVDAFEALAAVEKEYAVDTDRIVLTGYSMGGAGAWHIGAHYTDRFCAVQPGAGFVDLGRYQKITPDKYPVSYEHTLWSLYDVPEYLLNLFNVPVVVYNGEIDAQRASGEIMAELYRQHGRTLPHVLGPGLAHTSAKGELLEKVLALVRPAMERGRNRFPQEVLLQTRTLRYNRLYWVEVASLEEHWRDTRVEARRASPRRIELTTKNVRHLLVSPAEAGLARFPAGFEVVVHGKTAAARTAADRLLIDAAAGAIVPAAALPKDAKRHGLQGPIDDVLMAPFLVVTPSGKSKQPLVQEWVEFELDHFARRWRALYRGELRTKKDSEVTAADIRRYNLILFGDFSSNALIRRVLPNLPLRWDATTIAIGGRSLDAAHHVPILIHPNPLERDRYVVLNSGPTHREAHDHTNSLQNPKLPDWALVDVRTPPSADAPGKVVDADFFDEQWKVKQSASGAASAPRHGLR